jgi:hypothetical protein
MYSVQSTLIVGFSYLFFLRVDLALYRFSEGLVFDTNVVNLLNNLTNSLKINTNSGVNCT